MRKLGKILFCFVPFLATFVLQILVMIPIIVIYFVRILNTGNMRSITSLFEEAASSVSDTDFVIIASIIYAVANIVIFVIWYRALLRKQRSFCKNDFSIIKSLIPAIVLAFGLQYLTNYIMLFLSKLHPSWLDTYSDALKSIGLDKPLQLNIGISILILAYAIILGPISEELVFRGVTLSLAKKQMPFFLANILQAALFGLLHMNPLQSCYAFVIGLFLGYIAHNCGTIKATILLHIVFNLIGVVVSAYLPSYDGNAIYIHMLILAGCIVVTILGLLWYRQRK